MILRYYLRQRHHIIFGHALLINVMFFKPALSWAWSMPYLSRWLWSPNSFLTQKHKKCVLLTPTLQPPSAITERYSLSDMWVSLPFLLPLAATWLWLQLRKRGGGRGEEEQQQTRRRRRRAWVSARGRRWWWWQLRPGSAWQVASEAAVFFPFKSCDIGNILI